MTDALKCITENTAKSVGGFAMNKRFFDIIDRSKQTEPEEERTAEEIIDQIKNKLRSLG